MAKKSLPSITFVQNKSQLSDLLSKIKELVKLNDKIVFKLNEKELLIYSCITKGKQIVAFKNFVYQTNVILTLKESLEKEVVMIIKDVKKFIANLANYEDYDSDISFEMTYSEISGTNFSDMMKVSNGKLKLSLSAGDPVGIDVGMTIDLINKFCDIKKSIFNFDIDVDTFNKIKKMGTINITAKKSTNPADIDPLTLSVNKNKLSIGDIKWNLDLCDIDREDESFSFPKKYFNTITMKENVKIYVFDTFLMIKSEGSDLLITMETTV